MRNIKSIIDEHREDVRFNKTLNRITNKNNYKKHIKELIHRIDNPITMEEIEARLKKEEKSFSNKTKFNWFKFKKYMRRVKATAKIWVFYFKNLSFFKKSFIKHSYIKDGEKHGLKLRLESFLKFPKSMLQYQHNLKSVAMIYRLKNSVVAFDHYLLNKRNFKY